MTLSIYASKIAPLVHYWTGNLVSCLKKSQESVLVRLCKGLHQQTLALGCLGQFLHLFRKQNTGSSLCWFLCLFSILQKKKNPICRWPETETNKPPAELYSPFGCLKRPSNSKWNSSSVNQKCHRHDFLVRWYAGPEKSRVVRTKFISNVIGGFTGRIGPQGQNTAGIFSKTGVWGQMFPVCWNTSCFNSIVSTVLLFLMNLHYSGCTISTTINSLNCFKYNRHFGYSDY